MEFLLLLYAVCHGRPLVLYVCYVLAVLLLSLVAEREPSLSDVYVLILTCGHAHMLDGAFSTARLQRRACRQPD